MRVKLRVSIALIGIITGSAMFMHPAGARTSEESGFFSKVNAERSSRGIGTLSWSEELAAVARNHSRRMAASENLHHNPNLANEVDNWQELGENVGYGNNVPELHDAFMASNVHKEAILHRSFTRLGVGTTYKDGILWVTEVFELPFGSPQVTTKKVAKVRKPSSTRRSGGRTLRNPAAPAAAPAVAVRPPAQPASQDLGDLTRIMVAKVLGSDEPAVRSIHAAGDVSPANLAGALFRLPPRLVPIVRKQ